MYIIALLVGLLVSLSTSSQMKQLDCEDNDQCGAFEYEGCVTLGDICVPEFCCCWGQGMGGEYFRWVGYG